MIIKFNKRLCVRIIRFEILGLYHKIKGTGNRIFYFFFFFNTNILIFVNRENKMKENKKDFGNLLEKLAYNNSKDLVWFILGSLISSDTVIDLKTCEESILILNELEQSLEKLTPGLYTDEEIARIKDFCKNGLSVCNQELEIFKKNGKK